MVVSQFLHRQIPLSDGLDFIAPSRVSQTPSVNSSSNSCMLASMVSISSLEGGEDDITGCSTGSGDPLAFLEGGASVSINHHFMAPGQITRALSGYRQAEAGAQGWMGPVLQPDAIERLGWVTSGLWNMSLWQGGLFVVGQALPIVGVVGSRLAYCGSGACRSPKSRILVARLRVLPDGQCPSPYGCGGFRVRWSWTNPLFVRLLGLYIDYINDQGRLPVGLLHREVGRPAGTGYRLGYVCRAGA